MRFRHLGSLHKFQVSPNVTDHVSRLITSYSCDVICVTIKRSSVIRMYDITTFTQKMEYDVIDDAAHENTTEEGSNVTRYCDRSENQVTSKTLFQICY